MLQYQSSAGCFHRINEVDEGDLIVQILMEINIENALEAIRGQFFRSLLKSVAKGWYK